MGNRGHIHQGRNQNAEQQDNEHKGLQDFKLSVASRKREASVLLLAVFFFIQVLLSPMTSLYPLIGATHEKVKGTTLEDSRNSSTLTKAIDVSSFEASRDSSGNASTTHTTNSLRFTRPLDRSINSSINTTSFDKAKLLSEASAPPLNQSDPLYNQDQTTIALEQDPSSFSNSMDWAVPHFQKLFRMRLENTTEPNLCLEECLLESAPSYYVYPEHMLFSDRRFDISNLTGNGLHKDPCVKPKMYREGTFYEIAILNALMNHSMRTESQRDAKLFVLPVSFGAIFFDESRRFVQNQLVFDEIRTNLLNSTPFQEGRPHVLISMTSPIFNWHHRHKVGRGLTKLYETVKSVAVARTDDYIAANYAYRHNATPAADFRGFDEQFATFMPMTEYQFSVGLGGESRQLPLIPPTWDKFQKSKFFIFYHTRTSPSMCNSTAYRHAPVLNVSLDALPRSSIGWSIGARPWRQGFVDSKFCLVIRGDTPHSHALFNAVKVGCVPVVVSDWYPFFAPPFPTTLDMRDFCIFLPEEYFLSHTEEALQSLQHIPDNVIKAKLKAMEWAQRVMIVDHPRSLFVPAFVREALASYARPASRLLHEDIKA